MVEKIGHIKNPLSVIAIFAAIAETSGTIVLPFLDPENQRIYIWFLMLFPMILVGLFYLTLNFNHRVLYAPSDYKDENNFVNPYGKASPEEQEKKLREEIEEIKAEDSADKNEKDEHLDRENISADPSQYNFLSPKEVNKILNRQIMGEIALAEKFAINKLAIELNLNFKTDVRIELPDKRGVAVFDALAIDDKEIQAVEVKLFRTKSVDPSRFATVLEQSELVAQRFQGFDPRDFTLHIVAVMETSEVDISTLKNNLEIFARRYKVKVKIHIIMLHDLQSEIPKGL